RQSNLRVRCLLREWIRTSLRAWNSHFDASVLARYFDILNTIGGSSWHMSCTCKLVVLIASSAILSAADPSYYRAIQPVLQKNCVGCHQPAMKSSGLDLTTFDGFKTGGKHGAAFNAAAPEQSLIVRYITGENKPAMPLGAPPLSKEEVALVRDWIKSGA